MPLASTEKLLEATLADVTPLALLLKAIHIRDTAVVEIKKGGMTFIVDEGKTVQARAYLQASLFDTYAFNEEHPDTPELSGSEDGAFHCLEVSLAALLECLDIFGGGEVQSAQESTSKWGGKAKERGIKGATSMRLTYSGNGTPFTLLLTAEEIVTRCELNTYSPETVLELPFDDALRVQKAIFPAHDLKDALGSLIDPATEKITLAWSPPSEDGGVVRRKVDLKRRKREERVPLFSIKSTGTVAASTINFYEGEDIEHYYCSQRIENSYRWAFQGLCKPALQSSSKVSIRTDEAGLLSIQFMMELPAGKHEEDEKRIGFVELLCLPLIEDDEY